MISNLVIGPLDQGSGPRCRVGTSPAVLPGTLIPGPTGDDQLLHYGAPIGPGISSGCRKWFSSNATQPEVDPRQLLLWLLSQEPYPIYYLTSLLSSGIYN